MGAVLSPPQGIPVGVVMPFAGVGIPAAGLGVLPSDWLLCNGQAVSRTAYPALYALLGSQFGAGDGVTTFNVPDLRGRSPLGLDNLGGTSANRVLAVAADSLGGAGGAEDVVLAESQIPSHSHSTPAHAHTASSGAAGAHTTAVNRVNGTGSDGSYFPRGATGAAAADSTGIYGTPDHTHPVTVDAGGAGTSGAAGGGAAHSNMPPYLALGAIIKAR